MLGRESIVNSPDGRSWKVRRRWVERPVPSLRERFRRGRKEVDGEGVFDGLLVVDGVEGWGAVGAVIAIGAALRELRTALASTGPPERLSVGRPLATKPAGRRA